MSRIQAQVTAAESFEGITLLSCAYKSVRLDVIVLDNSVDIGDEVYLNIKSTAITLAKDVTTVTSDSNRFSSRISHLEEGKLFCTVHLDDELEAIVCTQALQNMNLGLGDEVIVMIKATDISIMKRYDD